MAPKTPSLEFRFSKSVKNHSKSLLEISEIWKCSLNNKLDISNFSGYTCLLLEFIKFEAERVL